MTVPQILGWADAFRDRVGRWPTRKDGRVGLTSNTWSGLDACLKGGHRGLGRGSSLAKLLLEHRGRRHKGLLPPLTPDLVLAWADAHHARTGRWPQKEKDTGPIPEAPGERWGAIDQALLVGVRGLPGGSSLARLLAAERGLRNPADVPRLEVWEILIWADNHVDRTGRWPTAESGTIPEAPGETWSAVDSSLRAGTRGLPGKDSLARLLARRRGTRNPAGLPPLTTAQLLRWADAHRRRTGDWPTAASGPIPEAPGETWAVVHRALAAGRRGLAGGSSLPRLLEAERGVRNPAAVPPLTPELILAWADAHQARTGGWPTAASGRVAGVPGETCSAVAAALETGCRGLPGGGSLAKLLGEHRGVRNHMALPPFTMEQILAWADAHLARTGRWPGGKDGTIEDAPGETWRAVEQALAGGLRGLPGGDTLTRLLARHRGKRNRKALPLLSLDQIRGWVIAHHQRTGEWPSRKGGPIPDAPGETWNAVDVALYRGQRGMPGGSSLPKVVRECQADETAPNRPA